MTQKIFFELVKGNEVMVFDCLSDLLFEQGWRIKCEIESSKVDFAKLAETKRKLYSDNY